MAVHRKPPSEVIIQPTVLEGLLVRCKGCGGFAWKAQLGMAGCGCCTYQTAFCGSCGHEDSARRGVLIHLAYFAKRPELDRGMHSQLISIYRKRRKA